MERYIIYFLDDTFLDIKANKNEVDNVKNFLLCKDDRGEMDHTISMNNVKYIIKKYA